MRYSIFSKAEQLKDKVKLESETKNKAYFDVDGEKLCLVCNGKYTYIESCTCKSHSIHGGLTDMKHLCSYVIALFIYLTERFKYKTTTKEIGDKIVTKTDTS